jgi:glycosyltransferase involved in cell wall biosynthesis
MRVSIITATYNSSKVLKDCIESLNAQDYQDIEHVIIDGASKDDTIEVLKQNQKFKTVVISEKDKGIYDALNKGIQQATGDVIGILHSDDFFNSPQAISKIVAKIKEGYDGVYSDLDYVYRHEKEKVFRHWTSGSYSKFQLQLGWMPPHPTLFLKKEIFQDHGNYQLKYRIAADYDFMLRILSQEKLKFAYIPETLVCMKIGGESNKSVKNLKLKLGEDYQIAKAYSPTPSLTVASKILRKIPQLLR